MGSPNEDGQQGSWISSAVATEGFIRGVPGSSDGKESACSAGDPGLTPGWGRSPGEGNGNNKNTPVFSPGESHGRRSLVGCGPQGCKESDTTERLDFHFHFQYR